MRIARPRPLLWAAMAAYGAGFAALSLLRHRAFETGRFDLGNMVQAVWSTAHGHLLQVTNLHGAQISRLAAHVDPILVAFAPLWWLWPSPSLLLTTQALAVALGALPLFWLARKHTGSSRAGLGFSLAYLLFPATQWMTLNEFHPVALACPLLLFAIWYLDEDRLLPFTFFAVVAALTREEIPLVIAGLGVWYAIGRRRWLAGGAIAAAGIAATAIAVQVVIPHFNHGSGSSFYGRYDAVGGSAAGIVRKAFTDPGRLLSVAFDHRGTHYLLNLLLPIAGLALAAPLVLVAVVPELALNLLSSVDAQSSIHYHYVAAEIPILFAAAAIGAGRLGRWAGAAATVAVLAALAGNYLLGPMPLWRFVPGGETLQARSAHVSRHDRIAARELHLIPAAAPVTATNALGAHLSERKRIFSFPYLRDAAWVIVDERKPSLGDHNDRRGGLGRIQQLRRDPRFRLVAAADGVLVFRRR
ncbi:MAG: DUF2079 domain-containing protein [Actinobacteria bacterium]|nr:MAG: DUF2079 domain-containing protein [Actinomycetota bacterium]